MIKIVSVLALVAFAGVNGGAPTGGYASYSGPNVAYGVPAVQTVAAQPQVSVQTYAPQYSQAQVSTVQYSQPQISTVQYSQPQIQYHSPPAVQYHSAPAVQAVQTYAPAVQAVQTYAPAVQTYAPQVQYAQPIAQYHAAPVVQTVAKAVAVQPEPFDPHPQYSYGYSVSDAVTGDQKSASESRDGDRVQGTYSLVEPDGAIRTVTYTADDVNGFNAVVNRQAGAVAVAPAVVKTLAQPQVAYGVPQYASQVSYATPAVQQVSYGAPAQVSYATATPTVQYAPQITAVHAAPQIQYSAPIQTVRYSQPQVRYSQPAVRYSAPSVSYSSAPTSSYGVPSAPVVSGGYA